MTYPTQTASSIPKILSLAGAAIVAAVSALGCSGSALDTAPFAPSAMPAATLSAEADGSSASFEALGKGPGKGRDPRDSGKGSGSGIDEDATTTTSTVVEAEGAIVTVAGTCPVTTFTIGTQAFTTDAATTYEHGTCADLAAPAEVEVHATTGADGRLTATRVEFAGDDDADDDGEETEDGEEDDEDEDGDRRGNPHDGPGPFEGTVSSFRGSCPVVTFNLKGMRVSTTEDTTYDGIAEGADGCALLRPNVKVIVTGTRGEAWRSFVADTITIVRTH